MRTRLRHFAALLALLALTASVVEQAWAAACATMEGSHGSSVAVDDSAPGQGHGAHDAPTHEEHRRDAHPDPSACPMALSAGMACGVAALPVPEISAPFGSEARAPRLTPADEAPPSHALSSLFRPPRR